MAAKTPKQKLFMLGAATLVLAICSYYLSVKKTLDLRSEHQELTARMENIRSLEKDLAHWRGLNADIDGRLGGAVAFTGFQENLLAETGRFCEKHQLVLTEFSEPFEGSEGGYRVETIILTLKGEFKPLLKLVHHLETSFKSGKLSSVEFVKEKNFRSGREELFLKLYVQKVMRDENENE